MIAFGLAIIPFVLYRYGDRIRARSPAAMQLARQLADSEKARASRQADKEKRLSV